MASKIVVPLDLSDEQIMRRFYQQIVDKNKGLKELDLIHFEQLNTNDKLTYLFNQIRLILSDLKA